MYNLSNIKATEGDISEPVTPTEAKSWLNVDYTNDDTLITGMVKGARQTIEQEMNMHLVPKAVTLDVELCKPDIVALPYTPSVTDLVVKELDSEDNQTTLTVNKDYFIRGNGLRLYEGRFYVSYTSVPVVPEDVKQAIKMEVAERYANRGENNSDLSKQAKEKIQPYIVQWL